MTPNSELRYYGHYYQNLSERPYLQGLAEIVLRNPDATYYDNRSGHLVAIKRLFVMEKDRDVEVAYEIEGGITWVVNISLINEGQQRNRLQNGRWVPYEPESEL